MLAVLNTSYGAFSSDLYHLLSLSFINSDTMAAEILLNRKFRPMYILQTKFETVCTAWSANVSRACCEVRRSHCNYSMFILHSVTFISFLRSKMLHSFVKLYRPFYSLNRSIHQQPFAKCNSDTKSMSKTKTVRLSQYGYNLWLSFGFICCLHKKMKIIDHGLRPSTYCF